MFRMRKVFLVTAGVFSAVWSACGETSVDRDSRKVSNWNSGSRPLVFGILSQPFYDDETEHHVYHDTDDKDYNHTYIAASYVKWLEDGGARSIPIPFDAQPALVEDILEQVDGVLFPGGGSSIPSSAIHIWELLHSKKYYYREDAPGDRIPLWGTCLGFGFIVQLAAEAESNENKFDPDILEKGYDSHNISMPLFDVKRGGLFKSDTIYEIVTQRNVTMHNHQSGISPQRFRENPGLSRTFEITSINYDRKGKPFVSTIEPKYQELENSPNATKSPPVYAVIYHPEKNSHEYGLYPGTNIPYEAIDHSPEGIALSLHDARFLVDLARENLRDQRQSAINKDDYNDIKYNKPNLYPMVYTYPRQVGIEFEERYIIPRASHWDGKLSAARTVEAQGENVKSYVRRNTRD